MPQVEQLSYTGVFFTHDPAVVYRLGEGGITAIKMVPMNSPGFYLLTVTGMLGGGEDTTEHKLRWMVAPSAIVLEMAEPKLIDVAPPPRLVIPQGGGNHHDPTVN